MDHWDNVNRKELFLLVRDSFYDDFSFVDVHDQLARRVFTEDECAAILSEPTERDQIDRMFFLLSYDETKSVQEFVDELRRDYAWLSELLDQCKHTPPVMRATDTPELDPYKACINASWMPNNRNFVVHRCNFVSVHILWTYLLNEDHVLLRSEIQTHG